MNGLSTASATLSITDELLQILENRDEVCALFFVFKFLTLSPMLHYSAKYGSLG